ncbi:hypothetical protein [Sporosalibacterium faouarense]|uniref:hypothetical protein n=1 Tax=Sporosalibacterium faouarense TaxID=516123 RepID=UPI00192AABE8|nr:hypothetical protein [Sporosalibacterium faouarense]
MDNLQEKKSLDTKMLAIMEEQLDQEAILFKKYLNAAEKVYDAEIKSIFLQASKDHKHNYESLLTYLKS